MNPLFFLLAASFVDRDASLAGVRFDLRCADATPKPLVVLVGDEPGATLEALSEALSQHGFVAAVLKSAPLDLGEFLRAFSEAQQWRDPAFERDRGRARWTCRSAGYDGPVGVVGVGRGARWVRHPPPPIVREYRSSGFYGPANLTTTVRSVVLVDPAEDDAPLLCDPSLRYEIITHERGACAGRLARARAQLLDATKACPQLLLIGFLELDACTALGRTDQACRARCGEPLARGKETFEAQVVHALSVALIHDYMTGTPWPAPELMIDYRSPPPAPPSVIQANVALLLGVSPWQQPASAPRVYLGGRPEIVFSRGEKRVPSAGPFIEVASAVGRDLTLGSGATLVIPLPIGDWALAPSAGGYARFHGNAWEPGVSAGLFIGVRQFSHHLPVENAFGVRVDAHVGFGVTHERALIVAAQLDTLILYSLAGLAKMGASH